MDAGLSVALFAPAWTYESCGGQYSAAWQRVCEDRLWDNNAIHTLLSNHSGSIGEGDAQFVGWTVGAGCRSLAKVESASNGPFPTAFIGSYDWCTLSQEIPLLVPETPMSISLGLWTQGVGPDVRDHLRMEVTTLQSMQEQSLNCLLFS